MFTKYLTTALIGSALLAGSALAQTAAPPANPSSTSSMPAASSDSTYQGEWRASKLVGLKVYNDQNESVGSIAELLMDKSGKINGVVIGVGGLLGVGEHDVAVAFDKVKWVNEPAAYTGTGGPSAANKSAPSNTTTGAATTTQPAASKPNPWYPDHAVYNASKDELKSMPEFKFSTK